MITHLTIKNFALIESLNVRFDKGLTTITGETGAGKSLLLGALGLLLGKRADMNVVKDASIKCVIEGTFQIEHYQLEAIFQEEDLDYEAETIVRREILPSGKSRAFVNDTPVTLQSLNKLGVHLIDIHSQHQTLEVGDNAFQFSVLDALAQVTPELNSYSKGLVQLRAKEKELKVLVDSEAEAKREYEYNAFLLKELEEVKLKPGEQEELEATYEQLNNIEVIQTTMSEAIQLLTVEESGINAQLLGAKTRLQKISHYGKTLKELSDRLESAYIEVDDIQQSLELEFEGFEADPNELERINNRLQVLYDLQKKHLVGTVAELVVLQEKLKEKVARTEGLAEEITTIKAEIVSISEKLAKVGIRMHNKRKKALPKLVNALTDILQTLGMSNATFDATIALQDIFFSNGQDILSFLFSANKGGTYGEVKKVASGGELSRIMLAIKIVLSKYKRLPTIIFDEIDTGVSGEVAQKMADLMLDMSTNLQVFSITHLPQIAAKGQSQFKVYKEDTKESTITQLRVLNHDERVTEIAQMLGGATLTDSAVTHARELLEASR